MATVSGRYHVPKPLRGAKKEVIPVIPVAMLYDLTQGRLLMEILTVKEVAALLRVSRWHVYELVKQRTKSGDVRENPLPCVRLGKSVRFRKNDVEEWVERLSAHNSAGSVLL